MTTMTLTGVRGDNYAIIRLCVAAQTKRYYIRLKNHKIVGVQT